MHNLEELDIPFAEDDEWLHLWFEWKKKEKERVIMMRWHERFKDAQIIVPINRPNSKILPIMIGCIEEKDDYLGFPWDDSYKNGYSDSDEIE